MVQVSQNMESLAHKRGSVITVDSYGNADGTRWNAYVQDFFDHMIAPELSLPERLAIRKVGLNKVCNELIETTVRNECARMHDSGERDMTVRVVNRLPNKDSARKSLHVVSLGQISRGLIIRNEPIERILGGRKTWEMRSGHTKIREKLALIKKGTKAIYGVAEIVDSRGPLTRENMLESISRHAISADRIDHPDVTKYRYAWVLQNVLRLKEPIPYQHTGGVIFVSLDANAIQQLTLSLDRG